MRYGTLLPSCEPVEVAAGRDVAHVRAERLRIDEARELHVAQLELPRDAHHVAVEALLGERAERAHAELAPEHHVERVRRRAT
jgi:hypothetical protein